MTLHTLSERTTDVLVIYVRYLWIVLDRNVDNLCIYVDAGENLLKPVSGLRRHPPVIHHFLSSVLGHRDWGTRRVAGTPR